MEANNSFAQFVLASQKQFRATQLTASEPHVKKERPLEGGHYERHLDLYPDPAGLCYKLQLQQEQRRTNDFDTGDVERNWKSRVAGLICYLPGVIRFKSLQRDHPGRHVLSARTRLLYRQQ